MSKKKGTGKFLGGALLGLGLGFLFAPKSGSETRKDLAKQTSLLWDKVRSLDAEDIKNKLENKLEEIEKGIKELDKETVLEYGKEKAIMLKEKAEELVNMAKEAGKPMIEDAAKTVKKELAVVTSEILKKLEEE